MLTYVVAFVLATAVAAAATPLVARVAHRFGWLDAPGERKVHTRAVPRLGGVAVVFAFFAPLAGLAIYTNRVSGFLFRDASLVLGLCLGGGVIVLLGVYDDLKGADAKLKLLVQSLVALGMWLAGFRIELFSIPLGDGVMELGRLSLPLTMFWFVGVINALNLIDGLDGLASGIALFAVIVLFGVSYSENAVLLCLLSAALAGALVGFLFFNFNPAKIFLGDSGSMFLGFTLAAISVWTQRKGATAVALSIPVFALGVPILDVTLSVVRRVSRGANPFRADREHVHHRLLALGLTHRGAVVTLYGLSGVFALGALAFLRSDTTLRAVALSVMGGAVLLLVRRVGVITFPSMFRRADGSSTGVRDHVRGATRKIRSASTPEQAWGHLREIIGRLGCEELRLAWCLGPAVPTSPLAPSSPFAPLSSNFSALSPQAMPSSSRSSNSSHSADLSQASEVLSAPEATHGSQALREPDEGGTSLKELVFHWRRDVRSAKAGWHVEGAPHRALLRLPLNEDELHLGELAVLVARRDMRGDRVSEFRIALELLRDALIDFLVGHLARQRLHADGRVLRLAEQPSSDLADSPLPGVVSAFGLNVTDVGLKVPDAG